MMTRPITVALILLLLAAFAIPVIAAPSVDVLTLSGPIEPAGAQFVVDSISRAGDHGAQAFVIVLDTPGGGMEPMRKMIQAILNARVPVIVYVPRGARAGSAGTFITIAANIAALAPGSNIGSAHPVFDFPIPTSSDKSDKGKGDVMMTKVVNDASAYIRSIAEERGRNAKWAEQAVRNSANVTAQEAVKLGIVDFVASDLRELLAKSDGRTVQTAGGRVTLHTKDAPVNEITIPWTIGFQQKLADPIIAFLIMLAAIFGIIFEINSPGAIAPGVIGAIALVLLLFSFSVIPVNAAGMLLVIVSIVLFILDVKVPTHGVLTGGGIIAFFLGSVMLFGSGAPLFSSQIATIAAGTAAVALFFIFLVGWGAKAQKLPASAGRESIIGRVVEARTDIDPIGKVFTEGTLWTAISSDGSRIEKGEKVRISAINGLKLQVDKLGEESV